MTYDPLTRVDIWHLENILFKLYRQIQKCIAAIDSAIDGTDDFFETTTLVDNDTRIVSFFEKPQVYEYGEQEIVALTEENFIKLRNFIIETQDMGLALDLTEQELNLHSFILFLRNINETFHGILNSIGYLEMLRDFRYEVYKWACLHANQIGSDINYEMNRRKDVTSLMLSGASTSHIKYHEENQNSTLLLDVTKEDDGFDLSEYFIATYDKNKIAKIYKKISTLAVEQDELYISKIISIIAYAHYQGLLRYSFSKTIKATLGKFHIEIKPNYLHPATFGQPTEKGKFREAYQIAASFFKSL